MLRKLYRLLGYNKREPMVILNNIKFTTDYDDARKELIAAIKTLVRISMVLLLLPINYILADLKAYPGIRLIVLAAAVQVMLPPFMLYHRAK